MTTPPEVEVRINDLREIFSLLLETISSDFFIQQKWGTLNFYELSREFEGRLKPALSLLMDTNLSFLSAEELDEIKGLIHPIRVLIEQISAFNIEESDAAARRSQIISQFRKCVRRFEGHVSTFSAPLLVQILSADETNLRFESQMREVAAGRKQVLEILSDVASTKKEAEQILVDMRTAAAESGTEKHAKVFELEAKSLRRWSYVWLAASGMAIFSTAYAAVYFYNNPIYVWSDITMAFQVVTAKVLLLALLVSTAVWCGRNYRAFAHEASVNRHRSNALSTFRSFVSSSEDPDIKNAVLLETTRSIFSHAPSGYLDKNDGTVSDGNRITEVIRSVNSAARVTS